MKFLAVVNVLGQLALLAMAAIVVLTAVVLLAGIAYPPLLESVLYGH